MEIISNSIRILFILFMCLKLDHAARHFRQGQSSTSKNPKTGGGNLFPSTFNVASKAEITANATCGEDGPETFCKSTESSRCAVCDSRSPDPGKRHSIVNVLDSDSTRWWQSPTLAKGKRYEFVTIVLDLKQIYQVEYVIVKSANSPRPAAWILERSIDGDNFEPWQYYAPNEEECWSRFSIPPTIGKPIYTNDDDVICTTAYSKIHPMENGEIHTQLVSGRPGASNHSSTLEKFTLARYVRLRFQSFRHSQEVIVDERRTFYSLREINIGGRCLCSGHASRCRYNVAREREECECERHTCGEKCERCCPMYNQIPWRSGASFGNDSFCEKCNCHGHANSCKYDSTVGEKKLSMDITGKFRGGGVCINCTKHTAGMNCEKCEGGYYRPFGVPPDAPEPCSPCDCNVHGSTGRCTLNGSSKQVACECKVGYSGDKCQKCAMGYREFPNCEPCPCDPRGTLPPYDCEDDCTCKTNANGQFCERCKPGYFGLAKNHEEGCVSCFCSGTSNICTAAKLIYHTISTLKGWLVSDLNASRTTTPDFDTDHGWLVSTHFNLYPYNYGLWLAPDIYCGNRLSSYGSNLTFVVKWVVLRGDNSGDPIVGPDVVLIGRNGMRIGYGEHRYEARRAEISVPLHHEGWYRIPNEIDDIPIDTSSAGFRGNPVTKDEMLGVLTDLKHLMIRLLYYSEQLEGTLESVTLPIGKTDPEGIDSSVEVCECPEGYAGLSCESCAWGYVKPSVNVTNYLDRNVCVECDCNGHAGSCDLAMGECNICEHHTVGPKCDRCAPGYYGTATRGARDDCQKCACPLSIPTNNFSPNCQLDDSTSGYVCTQCPQGYTGDHCESCDVGFFGDPTIEGGTCEPCLCNGGSCDQKTGQCLECHGNTEGTKCEKCKEKYFGKPEQQNCSPCNCDPEGSDSASCDVETGQCPCKPLFNSRECGSCIEGYGNVSAGCKECDCDNVGALDGVCDPVTGDCRCANGIVGVRCDRCDLDHYGLSSEGCKGCRCNGLGSTSSSCDIITGQCHCKQYIIGRQCDQCEINHWGFQSGLGCNPCTCDPVGSFNTSCDPNNGQCYCRPGVAGSHCDTCLPGNYGFSSNGCQVCDACTKPGHICDPETGRCVCPGLSYGDHCDRCRPGSWDLIPGIGCRPCACTLGSSKSLCDSQGQCPCRIGYDGLRCERCAKGYYGYPRCRPCGCNLDGTLHCELGVCNCDVDSGQCPCKEFVMGRQCDQCKERTIGLAEYNPKGCSECFCFGKSTVCKQSSLSWGQRRLKRPRYLYLNDTITKYVSTSNSGLSVVNGLTIIPDTDGNVTLPIRTIGDSPLYWRLPKSFLQDKVVSYGGFLRFKTFTEGDGVVESRSNSRYPTVQIQGNDQIILEYYSSFDNSHEIRLHESVWQTYNKPGDKTTRETLMVALQNLQHIFIKASDRTDFTKTSLLESSLDVAVLTLTRSSLPATGVEICECPPEYNGTSCQDPNIGYYRWLNKSNTTSKGLIDLVGIAKLCQCNGRSELCERETGHCLTCRNNTSGPKCESCAESHYGHPEFGGCKPCPCPHADKRFSSTCVVRSDNEPICHCKPGYTGRRCERCSYGYYGLPNYPGGECIPCDCNLVGSSSDQCDSKTGQCNCRSGFTGRDCSQCDAYRHVFIETSCTTCNDNCTGILLNALELLDRSLTNETSHLANGYVPPPWEELGLVDSNVSLFLDEIELEEELRLRMKNLPWTVYKELVKSAEKSLRNANEQSGLSNVVQSQSLGIKKEAFDAEKNIETIYNRIEEITFGLDNYGNDNRKVEIRKALEEARSTLNHLKYVDLSERTTNIQVFLEEIKGYIEWVKSLFDASETISTTQDDAEDYEMKFEDSRQTIEETMEILFNYDGLYNEINKSHGALLNNFNEIHFIREESEDDIQNGKQLVNNADIYFTNGLTNIQNIPELRNKLIYWTDKLDMKEEILYRLNDEYEEKYVRPSLEHAKNLSSYVDRYVGLFEETRNVAASPLKASNAFKNIVDSLKMAGVVAGAAQSIANEVYNQVFPRGLITKTLLNRTEETSSASSEQWEKAKIHEEQVDLARDQLKVQKNAVLYLKNAVNFTGIKDNEINVHLQKLQSDTNKLGENARSIIEDNEEITESIGITQKLIDDYKYSINQNLRSKLQELKREGDSKISLANEKLTEAMSNIKKADAKLISLSNASLKRQAEFDKWNDTLAKKLQKLKDKIIEARNSADGIRVSLRSSEGKKCVRSYRPGTLQPSLTTNIVFTLKMLDNRKEGSLLYLPSGINDDFIALEMVEKKVRFVWNVGGGTGIITHPEIIETGDLQDDEFWYRIEVERIKHVGKLSVRKQSSVSSKYLPVINSTNPEYAQFDVTSSDRVWIGGIPKSLRRPSDLSSVDGLPGCVHQVILNGKPIGLWNFITNTPDVGCEACIEGVENFREDVAYSFNGEGYAVRNRVSFGPYNKYTFGLSINFKTLDENALLFLAINSDNDQHLVVFLREGRVVLNIGYGGNISMEMLSSHKYNSGNWTKVAAFRQYQLRNNIEKCSLNVGYETDMRIGAPSPQPKKEDIPDFSRAKYYFGGLPPSFKTNKVILPTPLVPLLGCMSNIIVQEEYNPIAEQYYGVEPNCRDKSLNIVGFYGDGYLEHQAFHLRKISSVINFSFRTVQKDALLLVSTFKSSPNSSYDKSLGDNYYSFCVIDGRVQARLNGGKGELIVQSNKTFNDGRYHSIALIKRRKDIELRIDDTYQSNGRLPTSSAIKSSDTNGGLYFGGLPYGINHSRIVSSKVPLYGAIKDVLFNDEIIRFDEAIHFERALIGRPGPSMGKDPLDYVPSAPLSRGMSTQPEGCQKVPYYSLEPGALKFGDKPHSHTQLYLNFKKFWEKKYAIEFDFRTYYPNGLLFITPGFKVRHYLMMILRDGQLYLLVKSKQRREILLKNSFNDGNWHRLSIVREDKKLTLTVDSQTPRTIKIPKKIGLASMMYIGGLPESGTPLPDQVVVKLETLKGCIRGLRINGNVYDMVGSTSRAYNVGQCFPSVESGAYFQDEAYAVYEREFELGAVLELELEFRTSELSGVLLSVTGPNGFPSLSIELHNGKVIMSGGLADLNPLRVEQRFSSLYAICDNRWHRIQAVFNEQELALKVDEMDQKFGLPSNMSKHFMRSTVTSPLYIGGLPGSSPKGTLITRDYFNGCIRNVMIGGERRDWTDMAELHNIHLSSCPVQ